MPIIDYIKNDFTEIVTWEICEEIEDLEKFVNLTPPRLKKYESLPPKRAREFLGIKACLMKLNADFDILYTDKGKPYLDINGHISITHSYNMVSVAFSHFPIGIDIEKKRDDKILNIEKKFIRKDENSWIPRNHQLTDFLHIIWGAKESLYKLNGGNLWNFLNHYRIEPFNYNDKSFSCWISDEHKNTKCFGRFKEIKDYYLVWVSTKDA